MASHRRILQGKIALGVRSATLTLGILALYHQDFIIIANEALRSEYMSHILAIPFLIIYMIYRKRKMLKATISLESPVKKGNMIQIHEMIGTLLCLTAFLLYWRGSYTFTPLEYHLLTLPIFTAGLTLVLFNPQTLRQVAFPTTLLVLLTPPPTEGLYALGSTLSVVGSQISNSIVTALGVPSAITSEYGNPTIIITRPDRTTITFMLDIACSGIYSFVGFLVFALFIAYVTRDKAWKKAAIFLIGMPMIYLFNIIVIWGMHKSDYRKLMRQTQILYT